jgi:hypothetical protein
MFWLCFKGNPGAPGIVGEQGAAGPLVCHRGTIISIRYTTVREDFM